MKRTKPDVVLRDVEQALVALHATISGERETPDGATPHDLRTMIGMLEAIRAEIESGRLPPKERRYLGMGRAVVDAWPLNSELGALVIRAEQGYRALPES